MRALELFAAPESANPLLPNAWEAFGTIVGIAVFVLLIVVVFRLLGRSRRVTSANVNGEKVQLRNEIARRTDSIEKRLKNIEQTFEKVGD